MAHSAQISCLIEWLVLSLICPLASPKLAPFLHDDETRSRRRRRGPCTTMKVMLDWLTQQIRPPPLSSRSPAHLPCPAIHLPSSTARTPLCARQRLRSVPEVSGSNETAMQVRLRSKMRFLLKFDPDSGIW
jgi:hypothetical protein